MPLRAELQLKPYGENIAPDATANAIHERELFARLIDHAPDALVLVDEAARIVLANTQCERLFGYSQDELVGASIELLVPESLRARHVGYRNGFKRDSTPRPMGQTQDLLARARDGRLIPVEIGLSPISMGDSRLILASVRDVTERRTLQGELAQAKNALEAKVAELQFVSRRLEQQAADAIAMAEELHEARFMLHDAVDSISEGFALWSADDHLLHYNQRLVSLFTGVEPIIRPGIGFAELMTRGKEQRIFAPLSPEVLERTRARMAGRRTGGCYELPLASGRWLQVTERATSSGHLVAIVTDITDHKAETAAIARLAHQDPLTGLPNRLSFQAQFKAALAGRDSSGACLGLLMLDLDRFKPVNDSFGHAVGDELLRQVAARLANTLGARGSPARLGGDEFAVILPAVGCVDDARAVARRLIAAFAKPFEVEGRLVEIGVSIGASLYPLHTDDPERLLRLADIALYQAKDGGRNRLCVYGDTIEATVRSGGRSPADYVI